MKEEFNNLSDCIRDSYTGRTIPLQYAKEFIKKLKEKNIERAKEGAVLRNSDIDKLAGEKLT